MTKYILIDNCTGTRGYLRAFSGQDVDNITKAQVTLDISEAAQFHSEAHTYGVYNVLKGRFSGRIFICDDAGEIESELIWPRLEK